MRLGHPSSELMNKPAQSKRPYEGERVGISMKQPRMGYSRTLRDTLRRQEGGASRHVILYGEMPVGLKSNRNRYENGAVRYVAIGNSLSTFAAALVSPGWTGNVSSDLAKNYYKPIPNSTGQD